MNDDLKSAMGTVVLFIIAFVIVLGIGIEVNNFFILKICRYIYAVLGAILGVIGTILYYVFWFVLIVACSALACYLAYVFFKWVYSLIKRARKWVKDVDEKLSENTTKWSAVCSRVYKLEAQYDKTLSGEIEQLKELTEKLKKHTGFDANEKVENVINEFTSVM